MERLVSAIKNGTVIDHIPAGKAPQIVQLLKLQKKETQIIIGMHFQSRKLKQKDVIKIHNIFLSEEEANTIAIFAPDATISLIEEFKVREKREVSLPKKVLGVLKCPNSSCITRVETVNSLFYLEPFAKDVFLHCHFCEKMFHQKEIEVS